MRKGGLSDVKKEIRRDKKRNENKQRHKLQNVAEQKPNASHFKVQK